MTVAYNGSFTGTPSTGNEVLTVGTVNGRVASYVWGPDIASRPDGHSSWQRAGGVGGLPMVVDGDGTWPGIPATTDDHFFPLMDRLGNVTGCRKAATGLPSDSLSAVLEYDAFGQEVRSNGPASDLVPFHFSTKFTDQESGLNYYGYRYYDSGKGRWLNRDPIGEKGATHLYCAVRENHLRFIDRLGRDLWAPSRSDTSLGPLPWEPAEPTDYDKPFDIPPVNPDPPTPAPHPDPAPLEKYTCSYDCGLLMMPLSSKECVYECKLKSGQDKRCVKPTRERPLTIVDSAPDAGCIKCPSSMPYKLEYTAKEIPAE